MLWREKKEKGDGTHTPTHTHIGHEFVNMLLGLITELETFDQSWGREGRRLLDVLPKGKTGRLGIIEEMFKVKKNISDGKSILGH